MKLIIVKKKMVAKGKLDLISNDCSGRKALLYECGLSSSERLSIFSDDTDFSSVDAREFHSFFEKCIFLILVVRRERVLMDNYEAITFTTGAGGVR